MPRIRIMTWNIEVFGRTKASVEGIYDAVAGTVVGSDVDILIVLELRSDAAATIMENVVATLTAAAARMYPGAPAPTYYSLISRVTGTEYYGFAVRNPNVIRPLKFAPASLPPQSGTGGTRKDPLRNLQAVKWTAWPCPFPAQAPANLPAPPPVALVDIFAESRGGRRMLFAGQPRATGGGAQGRGYRLPCLAMFVVQGDGNPPAYYLLPIICCHCAAGSESKKNVTGGDQVKQFRYMHLAQLFSFYNKEAPPPPQPECGYVAANITQTAGLTAYPVTNIIITGDFNVDFLHNIESPYDPIAFYNREMYNSVTPTQQYGGSSPPVPPDATAGAFPAGGPPTAPISPLTPPPRNATVPNQTLHAAVTTQGTILIEYKDTVSPPDVLALRSAAFDNFFYGGAQLNTALVNFGAGGIDSGDVIDVPANIVQPGGIPGGPTAQIDVADPAAVCATKDYMRNVGNASNLMVPAGPNAPPLTPNDRLIGARLVSDHLPVVIDFDCP